MDNLHLRPATASDKEICYRIKQLSLKPYVNTIWGWDEMVQLKAHNDHFSRSATTIIIYKNKPIGYYELVETNAHFILKNILIENQFQNLGIGNFVMQLLIENANALEKSIQLKVFKVNGKAQKLYSKLGFNVVEITEYHLKMQKNFEAIT
ncbi:GNAT family N-acetyltransferase [Subsaximicrobium wynnwilliamsii]|uniref:GNAT family N-acetyltransferase n=1 Tax=Subsaximicrobium wynnwilliamsii TaxID=291179 RepID=A0A5C6ZGW9_9FLAO|nr:GNAT family N-acetyltransferase [Subsaximicrobium wynnwilliamsii]TXD82792.1 GNAT family N-acetyltransferase [Subsaximicrobium wynnwilliamsii]TXD88516.1 GNAT family N-acetyltransferase [Subsaximicrobium wynnwilliamsii]TXE02488.1 GNAT family N-acetyltransferase [Subsaximicrobium wynnwilliamsii]